MSESGIITHLEKEIQDKQRRMRDLGDRIWKLRITSDPHQNEDLIQEAGQEIPELERAILDDQKQLGALRQEYNLKSGALRESTAPSDPELAAVVDAWPALNAAIKAGILAMVRAAESHSTEYV